MTRPFALSLRREALGRQGAYENPSGRELERFVGADGDGASSKPVG
ncbi:MAG: hypothetical protein M3355_08610 [Actinomycetota bacterium]|nr:hypothetical protein [Actinomycetota bacterium]